MEKIVRSVCFFAKKPSQRTADSIESVSEKLRSRGFTIQTKRICSPVKIKELNNGFASKADELSVGTLPEKNAREQMRDFFDSKNVSFNIDLSKGRIGSKSVDLMFELIGGKPEKTFNFCFVFNNPASSPFFPSAKYERDGFSIGLQSTNLARGCKSAEEWLERMQVSWNEINGLFKEDKRFLGIDSSIAPAFSGNGSLINFIKKFSSFPESVSSGLYLKITGFIKEKNPKPIGLCGLMLPCLEDFELAEEYEKGNFGIERNLFLSLHSGLGIDTYPIGIDEKPEKILQVLLLVQGLSNKYKKPLSIRFVSDGKSKIGHKTKFNNQYLKDVIIRAL